MKKNVEEVGHNENGSILKTKMVSILVSIPNRGMDTAESSCDILLLRHVSIVPYLFIYIIYIYIYRGMIIHLLDNNVCFL